MVAIPELVSKKWVFLAIDSTRHWLSMSNLFLKKTLKWKDVSVLTIELDVGFSENCYYTRQLSNIVTVKFFFIPLWFITTLKIYLILTWISSARSVLTHRKSGRRWGLVLPQNMGLLNRGGYNKMGADTPPQTVNTPSKPLIKTLKRVSGGTRIQGTMHTNSFSKLTVKA